MTIDQFRRMALKIPTAVEQWHMNHPDFRIAGKIFASLGVPDEDWGMVKLTPGQQRTSIDKAPEAFKPSSGAWGRQGYTNVYLARGEGDYCTRRARCGGKECRQQKDRGKRPTFYVEHRNSQ